MPLSRRELIAGAAGSGSTSGAGSLRILLAVTQLRRELERLPRAAALASAV